MVISECETVTNECVPVTKWGLTSDDSRSKAIVSQRVPDLGRCFGSPSEIDLSMCPERVPDHGPDKRARQADICYRTYSKIAPCPNVSRSCPGHGQSQRVPCPHSVGGDTDTLDDSGDKITRKGPGTRETSD